MAEFRFMCRTEIHQCALHTAAEGGREAGVQAPPTPLFPAPLTLVCSEEELRALDPKARDESLLK